MGEMNMIKNTIKTSTFSMAAMLFSSTIMAAPATPHWDHSSADQGPNGDAWASIEDTTSSPMPMPPLNYPYSECGTGGHQSPVAINLSTSPITVNPTTNSPDLNPIAVTEKVSSPLDFHYPPDVNLSIYNSGHAVQVNMPLTYIGHLSVGQDDYPLIQFHFHVPSEHSKITSQGQQTYAGELHFVHQRADGKIVVLGVFLDDTGAETTEVEKALDTILGNGSNLPNNVPTIPAGQKTATNTPAGQLNPLALLPKGKANVFTYAGSLTTPPCSEGVNWYVLAEPIQVSSEHLITLTTLYPNGNRFTQNSNSRVIGVHHNKNHDNDADLYNN
jgi:carbonic anhydrase